METVLSVAVVGPFAAKEKSTPVPESVAVCVVEGALSVKVSVPFTGPATDGVKTICNAQLLLTAIVVPHEFVAMVKPLLATTLEMVSGRPPLLVSVSVCGCDVRPTPVAVNVTVAGLNETPGGATPTPLSATLCVRNWSVTVSDAVRVPTAVGVNVTLIAQLEFAASEFPQLLVTLKSLEFPGVMDAVMSVSATPPAFVSTTCCAALVVVICCVAKVSDVVESVSVAGVSPTPFNCAVWVPTLSVMLSVPARAPLAVGVKVMESVQDVDAASELPQVFALIAKSPVTTGACSVAVLPPVFATVMFCATAVWFTMVAGNVSDGGVNTIDAGGVPTPVSVPTACPPTMFA